MMQCMRIYLQYMAFTNSLVGCNKRVSSTFVMEGNIASEASRILFYRPLASIMKTCGNEDVPL